MNQLGLIGRLENQIEPSQEYSSGISRNMPAYLSTVPRNLEDANKLAWAALQQFYMERIRHKRQDKSCCLRLYSNYDKAKPCFVRKNILDRHPRHVTFS